MDSGGFRCRFQGRAADERTAEVLVVGPGDPGNRVTVQCVCESAFTLACDEPFLPLRAGTLTPSTGIGKPLVERLRASGMTLAYRAL